MIPLELQSLLQNQLTLERTNAAAYDALDFSLRFVNWPGSAHYMHESAEEERTHAKRFAKYLIDRNVFPQFDALPVSAMVSGDNLLAYFKAALDRERLTTAAINALHEKADELGDPQTCTFLIWFVDEQTKSEADLQDIIKELSRTDVNNQAVLDRKYGKLK
jgi:ferritin